MAQFDGTAGAPLSRRRIIQGAAWATPAVIVATALPAAAASQEVLLVPGYSAYSQRSLSESAGGGSGNVPVFAVQFNLTLPSGVSVTSMQITIAFQDGLIPASPAVSGPNVSPPWTAAASGKDLVLSVSSNSTFAQGWIQAVPGLAAPFPTALYTITGATASGDTLYGSGAIAFVAG